MPKHRYRRRKPTHAWQQIRPLLKDSAQITYEIIRPVILWGVTPKERAVETGMPQRTIYYKANLFDQVSLLCLELLRNDVLFSVAVADETWEKWNESKVSR